MSNSVPANDAPSSWRKRVKRQKQQADCNLGTWFINVLIGGRNKSKLLREQDEETAQNLRRRPVGTLSAVTNQQQANAARREEIGRPKPMRQKSFLRQQLQEMKRQSAEMLRLAQKRMDGEIAEEEEEEEAEKEEDPEDKSSSSEDEDEEDEEGIRVIDDLEDALGERLSSDPARSRSSSSASSRRRSVTEEQQKREDELKAYRCQREEFSQEASRRMSQATQLYAEAINALDYALQPARPHRPSTETSSKPLLLGVKEGSANMPKSEWI